MHGITALGSRSINLLYFGSLLYYGDSGRRGQVRSVCEIFGSVCFRSHGQCNSFLYSKKLDVGSWFLLLPFKPCHSLCLLLVCIKPSNRNNLKISRSSKFISSFYENSCKKWYHRPWYNSWRNSANSLNVSSTTTEKTKRKVFYFNRYIQISISEVKFLQS